tara:strand:- start:112 stop:495 length:384 start_codon:yes stop_codon:yes gene_type:complete
LPARQGAARRPSKPTKGDKQAGGTHTDMEPEHSLARHRRPHKPQCTYDAIQATPHSATEQRQQVGARHTHSTASELSEVEGSPAKATSNHVHHRNSRPHQQAQACPHNSGSERESCPQGATQGEEGE